MPGRGAAPRSGREPEESVADVARQLGLEVRRGVKIRRRLWGAERKIDLVLTDREQRKSLGVECKFQGARGRRRRRYRRLSLTSRLGLFQGWWFSTGKDSAPTCGHTSSRLAEQRCGVPKLHPYL